MTTTDKKLNPYILQKIAGFRKFQEDIELILHEARQPLSVHEITVAASNQLNRKVEPELVRRALQRLENAGLVSSRVETANERELRYSGATPRSYPARLYAPGKTVPARTIASVVPGAEFKKIEHRPGGRKRGKTAAKKISPSNPSVNDVVIEVLSNRIIELEKTISEIRRLIA
jgi:DNA-binding transcriptional ArsR family regulator